MGRKSSLTPDQWIQIERRIVLDGESVNALAKEFSINESCIRRKIKPNKAEKAERAIKLDPSLPEIAAEKIAADSALARINHRIAELPYAKQQIVSDLTSRLTNISGHLCSAAEYGAATAHRLSGIANGKAAEIDDAAPIDEESLVALKGIAALTRMANESANIGLNLLSANKDRIKEMDNAGNEPPNPSTEVTFRIVRPDANPVN